MAGGTIQIRGGVPLRGASELPVDRMVAQRALVLAALAEDPAKLHARLCGAELEATLAALSALGVTIDRAARTTRIAGRGLHGLMMPSAALDCRSSQSTLALLTGVLAGQRFGTRLLLSATPARPAHYEHLIGALRARGAYVAASGAAGEPLRAPLSIAPLLADERLRAIECALPAPDTDTKSALLLSGLFAAGSTAVAEPLLSPDHTERMLTAFGVPVRRLGSMSGFDPAQWNGRLSAPSDLELPGDAGFAALIAAVAAVTDGSRVALRDMGWNTTRTGVFDALRLWGGRLLAVAKGDRAGHEPIAEVQVRSSALRGGTLGGEIVGRSHFGIPALCLIGACAQRGMQLLDADDVFAPEGDAAWSRLAALLTAFGTDARPLAAGLSIAKAAQLTAAEVDAHDDPRLASAAVIFGLAARGETRVYNANSLIEEWPDGLECLRALGAQLEVDP